MARPNLQDNSNVGVRSNKDLSFNWLGSADFGRLVPFHWEELVATDKVLKLHPKIEVQMLSLASPTFGKMSIYVHYFFVPHRLTFAAYNQMRSDTGPYRERVAPYFTPYSARTSYKAHVDDAAMARVIFKHWTSMGLVPFWLSSVYESASNPAANRPITALPFLAYQRVWWDFYRDPEVLPDSSEGTYLVNPNFVYGSVDPFNDNNAMYQNFLPRYRSLKDVWFAELFASPGNASSLPLMYNPDFSDIVDVEGIDSGFYSPAFYKDPNSDEIHPYLYGSNVNDPLSPSSENVSQISSPEIRKLEALQRIAERYSLSGKRVIDQLYSQYGVRPEFEKLSMAQYLGGAKASVLVQDITSSADTTSPAESTADIAKGSPLGAKAGSGYCSFDELDINFEAREDGIILGIFSIVPHIHFVQGLSRKWNRSTRDTFYKRELSHTGMVAVSNIEVGMNYVSGGDEGVSYDVSEDEKAFAFSLPYYEYGFHPDIIAGDFLYYHNIEQDEDVPTEERDLKYMQSMGMYVDYPLNRKFNAANLQMDKVTEYNKIFNYLGGTIWSDSDDHFHVNCDVECIVNRPMDGAVPTLETTQVPHADTAPLGTSTTL